MGDKKKASAESCICFRNGLEAASRGEKEAIAKLDVKKKRRFGSKPTFLLAIPRKREEKFHRRGLIVKVGRESWHKVRREKKKPERLCVGVKVSRAR